MTLAEPPTQPPDIAAIHSRLDVIAGELERLTADAAVIDDQLYQLTAEQTALNEYLVAHEPPHPGGPKYGASNQTDIPK